MFSRIQNSPSPALYLASSGQADRDGENRNFSQLEKSEGFELSLSIAAWKEGVVLLILDYSLYKYARALARGYAYTSTYKSLSSRLSVRLSVCMRRPTITTTYSLSSCNFFSYL